MIGPRPTSALARASILCLTMVLWGCAAAGHGAKTAPGLLARLDDGRHINLRCAGRGSPTVLLESGFGADSGLWWKVQPALAAVTRTCAYDRAGYGFSDPGPAPRDGAAIARDFDQALQAANIRGPFIVVAHSAGGLYARLFAARRLKEIAGLVFLDATPERLGRLAPTANDGFGHLRARAQDCLDLAMEPGSDAERLRTSGCDAGGGSRGLEKPVAAERWRNRLSELNELARLTSDEVGRIGNLLQQTPAFVIAASETVDNSRDRLAYNQPSAWLIRQQMLARGFYFASQETVVSSHMIPFDRPDVVIDATVEMIQAARQRRQPTPLPQSEPTPNLDPDGATTWSGGEGP